MEQFAEVHEGLKCLKAERHCDKELSIERAAPQGSCESPLTAKAQVT